MQMRGQPLIWASVVAAIAVPAGAHATPLVPETAEVWAAHYDGPSKRSDSARGVAVAPDGSRLYVVGSSENGHATIAYSGEDGSQVWLSRYGSYPSAIALSPDGTTVFVSGTGGTGTADYDTVAYSAATGAQLWVARFNGAANRNDSARALAVSPDGSTVFVTGSSEDANYLTRAATVAYDTATGLQKWFVEDHAMWANSVAVSPDGSTVFVAGDGSRNIVAYSAASGARLWDASSPSVREVRALAVSSDGSTIFISGAYGFYPSDYSTAAHSAVTGARLWDARYDGPGHGHDAASSLAVSPDGETVFVTGASARERDTFSYDYTTIAYAAGSGAQVWVARYSSLDAASAFASGIVVGPDGRAIYVTGTSTDCYYNCPDVMTTVAMLAGTGNELWVGRYTGKSDATAASLAVTSDGSMVFVIGSTGSAFTFDYATIAYQATLCLDAVAQLAGCTIGI